MITTEDFTTIPIDAEETVAPMTDDWIWQGYIRPGDLTLLTSQGKLGKTTLLAGLMQQLGSGQPFLGRNTRPSKVVVVTEESKTHWDERRRLIPIRSHASLMLRPFSGRPSVDQWNRLIDRCRSLHEAGNLDLLVIDPLASFLPGRCESDAATLIEALQPLLRLAQCGVAVLLMHHPRKEASDAGMSARGSTALIGIIDISLELVSLSHWKADFNRRLIRTRSRSPATPNRLIYEWKPSDGSFTVVPDSFNQHFEENWKNVQQILKDRNVGITPKEILEYWPEDLARPGQTTLYAWLNKAFEKKLCRREGSGSKKNPWRYRLANKDDKYYDRGELPPLGPLFGPQRGHSD